MFGREYSARHTSASEMIFDTSTCSPSVVPQTLTSTVARGRQLEQLLVHEPAGADALEADGIQHPAGVSTIRGGRCPSRSEGTSFGDDAPGVEMSIVSAYHAVPQQPLAAISGFLRVSDPM